MEKLTTTELPKQVSSIDRLLEELKQNGEFAGKDGQYALFGHDEKFIGTARSEHLAKFINDGKVKEFRKIKAE